MVFRVLSCSESAKVFRPLDGVWLAPWIKLQIFIPIFLLQCLNLFWYYLILRILFRYRLPPRFLVNRMLTSFS